MHPWRESPKRQLAAALPSELETAIVELLAQALVALPADAVDRLAATLGRLCDLIDQQISEASRIESTEDTP